MALVSAGALTLDDVERLWSPAYVATPALSEDERHSWRNQWFATVKRVEGTIPELSAVSF
jgi:hypothetical protein